MFPQGSDTIELALAQEAFENSLLGRLLGFLAKVVGQSLILDIEQVHRFLERVRVVRGPLDHDDALAGHELLVDHQASHSSQMSTKLRAETRFRIKHGKDFR